MCSTIIRAGTNGKVYTWKDLVLLETYITEFHEKFYIPAIPKLEFHFTHMRI